MSATYTAHGRIGNGPLTLIASGPNETDVATRGGAWQDENFDVATGKAPEMIYSTASSLNVYKNTLWNGVRDYECTNVVACVADAPPAPHYVPADESLLEGKTQLWIESGVRYYGWL